MHMVWPYPIGKYRNMCIQTYFHLVSEYCQHTRDVGLPNGMVRPMKLRCCVFNKVFQINHWRDIFYCSYMVIF